MPTVTPIRPRSRSLRRASVLLLALPLLVLAAPRPQVDPLRLALREAQEACRRARGPFAPRRAQPLFDTQALRGVLDDDPRVLAREHGELDALRDEAEWLSKLRDARDLGDRSWGDVHFLAGMLHWYLARATGRDADWGCRHERHPPTGRVVFRDVDYLEVLSAWD
jgi:hypothetical protein